MGDGLVCCAAVEDSLVGGGPGGGAAQSWLGSTLVDGWYVGGGANAGLYAGELFISDEREYLSIEIIPGGGAG